MRLLVVGSGGREHALVEALSRSQQAEEIFAAPGNPGMASVAELVDIPVDDLISLRNFARTVDIDLTIVGPEAPLVGGIAEAFWEAGLKIFGPSRGAARIEGSKIFAKKIMQHAGVPTARSEAFDREAAALAYLRSLPPGDGYPVVVKVDGLAAGKGVMIADSYEEAEDAVRDVFDGAFGAAGERLILEEYLRGKEASVFALTDGRNILPFVPAQDYKRLEDGGEGPNTGGMGAYSPTMWMDSATYMTILEEIINPTVHQLALIGAPYTGLLYAGVMITDEGPKALEFNCRFGDPETQALLPRIETDLLELMVACVEEDLGGREISWSPEKAVCVVLASEGYPESPTTGDEISGLEDLFGLPGVRVYHAATRLEESRLYTAGGRVLNVVGTGDSIIEARARAYAAVELIDFPGKQYRTDIALEALELEEL
ncbi:MAG: phosphoribosylamine--glycine ligase [Actinomycetota bacterium]|jgi:phosphoribosylamine--glycine ligase|nr:phosphoribosylamine--glycine ligase [Rubrobacter sp.]MDQ3735942.1 phosphoribosylamine--glycine ligase [Actinomycetota bacterium]MDQ3891719.1 phosphoribosylamine--glycine ligase [Actinomycetota bacterium]MDQ5813301.1 phosphoribosylamine--glycine ligase [Actinomycetota bacterium]